MGGDLLLQRVSRNCARAAVRQNPPGPPRVLRPRTRGDADRLPAFPAPPPVGAAARVHVHTLLGRLLCWERTLDNAAGAFPSFHVIWAVLAASVYASRWPGFRWVWRGWAALVAVSCVSTGQHPAADVAGGLVTAWLGAAGPPRWETDLGQG